MKILAPFSHLSLKRMFQFPRPIILAALFIFSANLAFAATFTVTKVADTNDGICDADCSLREAITAANADPNADIISFDPATFGSARTITLSGTALTIADSTSLAINGAGSDLLTISGNNLSQVFVTGSNVTFSVADLSITSGNALAGFDYGGGIATGAGGSLTVSNAKINNCTAKVGGGAISSLSNLTVSNSTISGNTGSSLGGGLRIIGTANISNSIITTNAAGPTNGGGGGIYTSGSTTVTTIANSSITNNTSAGAGGGIVNKTNGILNIDQTTISGNTASTSEQGGFGGGGIYNEHGSTASITDTCLSGNSVTSHTNPPLGGGGINNLGVLTLSNSTVSSNVAGNSRGGGIYNGAGSTIITTLDSDTIVNNTAGSSADGTGSGGGIYNTGIVNAHNTLIAHNADLVGFAPDFRGPLVSQGYDLIEKTSGMLAVSGTTTGNILGLDPQLVVLRNNGGATKTIALQPTSPAIDAGDPNTFPVTDQRGVARPQNGDLIGTARTDIGAYERQVTQFVVTKTADTNDGACDADCSLREAVAATNAAPTWDNAIVFEPATFGSPQTIILSGSELEILNNATLFIIGPGASLLTISGNNQSRVFSVRVTSNVAINGVSITGGNGVGAFNSGFGGALYFDGAVLNLVNSMVNANSGSFGGGITLMQGITTITNCNVNSNLTVSSNGGIYNRAPSSLTINNSTVDGNTAPDSSAGGIANAGTLLVTNSTVNNNVGHGVTNFSGATATFSGSTIDHNRVGISTVAAGLYNLGTMTISGSTISHNTAGSSSTGGGIFNTSVLTMKNSTVSGNVAPVAGGLGNASTGTATLDFVTIAGNIATVNGGGLGAGGVQNDASTSFRCRSCLIANNVSTGIAPDFQGTLNSNGYNLIKNTNGTTVIGVTSGNLLNVDPKLDPVLRFNGGPTATHSLRLGSPALDQGGDDASIITDQRGYVRPFDFPSIPNASGNSGWDIGAFERQANDADHFSPVDFDGDGKSDESVFRPSNGTWYLNRSQAGFTGYQFGTNGDMIVPADFTGDGKTDVAVFRPPTGTWFVLKSDDNTFYGEQFGVSGDIPAPGDYDGDGKADTAVFRPSTGTWFIQGSTAGFTATTFGSSEDVPTVGDFDGDGKSDVAVFRPSSGTWFRLNSSNGAFFGDQFGQTGDKVVPADYTGDGKTDLAVWRPSNGTWYIKRSEDNSFYGAQFGVNGDLPAPGDYDGDGKADITVFRPSSGTWFEQRSTSGFVALQFGTNGDKPAENAFGY